MKVTTLPLVHTTLACGPKAALHTSVCAATCLASLLTCLAHPARAAVTEAWVHSSNNGTAWAAAVDGWGNVVVTGWTYSNTNFNSDYYTAKYAAADGALLWEKRYHGPVANSDDQATAVALDGSGNVVVTGYSFNTNSTNPDYYTAKYAATDGALLWENRYNGNDQARAVTVDRSGNVLVTGNSATVKYAAEDGGLLWEKRYTDAGTIAVAVDASANVVVTGYSYNTNFTSDHYTAKYAAVNGALLWEKRGSNGAANNFNSAQAVAVDGSGNVVVTGYSYNTNFNYDYYTAKYAAADGALLWEKRYNGPANKDDLAQAVAVDATGNVVVTGVSDARFGGYFEPEGDYYTAKYASANGALLWERRYNGPANGFDYAYSMMVDGSGNVLVTGVTDSSFFGDAADYYTAKYAAADGALLWEKRYNGPANGWDSARSLALGPNGMIVVTGTSSGNYVTVVYWENLPPVAIERIPTGIRLRFTGVPGRSYNIERAPAVTGPWSTLATPTTPPGGLFEYVDTNAPMAAAYYRTSAP